jgi:HSP20 family protein
VTSLQRRRPDETNPFTRLDRMFDEWFRALPMRRPLNFAQDLEDDQLIRVDEYRDGDAQVIRAELPGIDPAEDVEITVQAGMLRISAQRKVEEETQDKGYTRRELRYGSFSRTLPMPDGAAESDIKASYRDGILEIRIPIVEPTTSQPTRIAVSKE